MHRIQDRPSYPEGERKIGESVLLDPLERETLNDQIIFLASHDERRRKFQSRTTKTPGDTPPS
jgi:hypothetical protein